MKMIMALAPEERREELRELLSIHGLNAFSEVTGVTGEGEAGRHFGNATWPGRSVLLFAVVPDERVPVITEAIRSFVKKLYPAEGARAFILPVEGMI